MQQYGYRYMNAKGVIKEGNTEEAKSAAIYRTVARLKVGQRNTKALHSAGIKWIERTS